MAAGEGLSAPDGPREASGRLLGRRVPGLALAGPRGGLGFKGGSRREWNGTELSSNHAVTHRRPARANGAQNFDHLTGMLFRRVARTTVDPKHPANSLPNTE